MQSPRCHDLPSLPAGKAGWPWTKESQRKSVASGDGMPPLPRLSVVTPCYNQESFIEETIRSVLLQGYPDLEYIIIDGGSTDGTLDVIQKYEPWLTHWESKPDRGQSHAINKGWKLATGEMVGWLNSDDIY